QRSLIHRGLEALLDGWDKLTRDVAALDLINELETDAGFVRTDLDVDLGKLSATTRLLLVCVVLVHTCANGFAVSHLRTSDIGLYLELAPQAIDDDLQVQLAHAGDDRLAGLLVGRNLERRILFGKLLQTIAEL